jgi:hypothetical protein
VDPGLLEFHFLARNNEAKTRRSPRSSVYAKLKAIQRDIGKAEARILESLDRFSQNFVSKKFTEIFSRSQTPKTNLMRYLVYDSPSFYRKDNYCEPADDNDTHVNIRYRFVCLTFFNRLELVRLKKVQTLHEECIS